MNENLHLLYFQVWVITVCFSGSSIYLQISYFHFSLQLNKISSRIGTTLTLSSISGQVITTTLGFPPDLDCKILLLKRPQSLITRH